MNNPEIIHVGDYFTHVPYTDNYPYEVIKVINTKDGRQKEVIIRAMTPKRISGSAQDGSAKYEIVSNPESNDIHILKWSKVKGFWYRKGDISSRCKYYYGYARYHYDPHF